MNGSAMWFWTAFSLLMLTNVFSLAANLLMLPGNWLMVAAWGVFLWAVPPQTGSALISFLVVAGIAAAAEVLEAFGGAATAARLGASRRAMLFSMVLSIACGLLGALVIPIPIVGSAVGAVLGALVGAFAGAWLGEASLGTDAVRRHQIGRAALFGRMLGMLAKFSLGVAVVVYEIVVLARS